MTREELIKIDRFLETYNLRAEDLIKTLAVLAKEIDGWGDTDTHYEACKLCMDRLGLRNDDGNFDPYDEDYAAAIVTIVSKLQML